MNASFKRYICAVALMVGLFWGGGGVAYGACSCEGEALEIVFLLDCSGSMNHMLNTLQQQVKHILDALDGQVRSKRASIIVFRTKEYTGRHKKLDVLPFTTDSSVVIDFMRRQAAAGGGEELIEAALQAATEKLSWSKGARKVVVLLGDEQPKPEALGRCVAWVKKMKSRGIVLHAVTASQTAWMYWAPINELTWKQRVRDMGKDAKRVFKLPRFTRLAEAGGGLSVSSWNSRELVLWLLGFGLGLTKDEAKKQIDVGRFLEWSKKREMTEDKKTSSSAKTDKNQQAGLPLVAWVKHGGDWKVPHAFGNLFGHLEKRLKLSGPARVKVLGLLNPDLPSYPILYVTGHGPVKWSATEQRMLKRHLNAGGFLFADACCGDAAFSTSIRNIFKSIYPKKANALGKLPANHGIFSCGYRIEKVARSKVTRTGKLESVVPELHGVFLRDANKRAARLAAVFSPHDLGCSWKKQLLGMPCMHADDDGRALSANIFVWALTR